MLGRDAEIWVLPELNRPSPLPQWADLDIGLLVHFDDVLDCSVNMSRDGFDGSTRCETPMPGQLGVGEINVTRVGDLDVSCQVAFQWEKQIGGVAHEFAKAVASGRTVAALVLDSGLYEADGTTPETGYWGLWCDWTVLSWQHPQSFTGSQTIRMRIEPAWSATVSTNTDAPAGVVRTYPELIPLV